MDNIVYDVAVIGAGVVGSAIARELSRYDLACVLVEAGSDVGVGTSKANTALWHTGFDAKPDSLESRLLRRSWDLMNDFIPQAGVPFERIGGLLVAWTSEQSDGLPGLVEQSHLNGVDDVRLASVEEVYGREPHLRPGALGGLFHPDEGILCPYTLPLALATQAVLNGAALCLESPVREIETLPDGVHCLRGPWGELRCRHLVNAAGLRADEIDRLMGHSDFTVTPRRGQLIVFDKLSRRLVNHVLLPVPTAYTKGVLISPTVYGNVMLGPTAEDLQDKTDTATTEAGLNMLWEKGRAILPELMQEEVTATYAGLRAATENHDYHIRLHAGQRYVTVGSIRSTGISGCMGIAEYVVELLAEAGLGLQPKSEFKPVRMPYIGEAGLRACQSADMIAANPDYGRIVCHCERVSRGEILDALNSTIPARTLDGLRRRTRALQGRCQGFNCQAEVTALTIRESGLAPEWVLGLEAANGR